MKINSTTLGFAILVILFGSIAASISLGWWQSSGGEGRQNRAGHSGENETSAKEYFTASGIINAYDSSRLTILTNEGQSISVQVGNSRYQQSIGFAPQIGEGATISGFIGEEGSYNAVTITLASTGKAYLFRDENGEPLWSKGNGNGGNH